MQRHRFSTSPVFHPMSRGTFCPPVFVSSPGKPPPPLLQHTFFPSAIPDFRRIGQFIPISFVLRFVGKIHIPDRTPVAIFYFKCRTICKIHCLGQWNCVQADGRPFAKGKNSSFRQSSKRIQFYPAVTLAVNHSCSHI